MEKITIPKKSLKVASRIVGEEAVIVNLDENIVNVLNPVGSRIWELIDGSRNTTDIIKIISDEFDVSIEKATKDTEEFLEELLNKGMIEITGNS